MSEEHAPMHWSSALETVLKHEGEKCLCLSWLHNQAQQIASKKANALQIPVIILSTLSGTASVGQDMFRGFEYASLIIGLVSILCGVLNTLNSYFAFSKAAEGHRISSLHYNKVYQFIMIELALPRTERMRPEDLLKTVRSETERLQEVSPQLPQKSIDDFKSKFGKQDNIAKPPAANGLHPIEIFTGMTPRLSHFTIENPLHERGVQGTGDAV